MIDLNEAIDMSKKILDGTENEFRFSKYTSCYLYTTENIKAYLTNLDFNKDIILSVIGSGDQLFNFIYAGVKEIDAFDINILTYFTYHLKKGIILNKSLTDFLQLAKKQFLTNSLGDFSKLIEEIDLSNDIYTYYQELIKYQFDKKREGLNYLYRLPRTFQDWNLYNQDEDSYLKLKNNLEKQIINFYFDDARNIPKQLRRKYDLILLSNISDYFGNNIYRLTAKDFNNYLRSYYWNLNSQGVLIQYFYYLNNHYIVENSYVTKNDLTNIKNITDKEGYYLVRKK